MNKFISSVFLLLCAAVSFSQANWNNTSFVHRSGSEIHDGGGNEIRLEGFNLGGWLMWEGWIWGGGFTQEKTIFDKIETKIGAPGAEAFRDSVYWNFITEKDFEALGQSCYNVVRVPFNHTILEDDAAPFVYKQSGWDLLDSILSWGEQNDIYILLDLHSAPGGQSNGFTADPDATLLWDDQLNKDRTVALWKEIAERYADRGIVAGYDLLNEPSAPVDADLVALYDVIIDSIRTVDNNHMLFIEGDALATDFSMFSVLPDPNMLFEFHLYTWFVGDITAEVLNYTGLSSSFNVPVWCGEWGENNYGELEETVELFRDDTYKIRGSAFWTFKKSMKDGQYPYYYGVDSTALWNKTIKWIGNPFSPQPSALEMNAAIDEFLQNIEIVNCDFNSTLYNIVNSCGWVSAEETEAGNDAIYPNPFSEEFYVQTNGVGSSKLVLYDITGAIVRIEELANSTEIIERGNLAPGIYFYAISRDNEVISLGKVIAK